MKIKGIEHRSDKELIAAFRAGDESSYVELISRYTDKAFNLAIRLTRNREDAEEVIQDVFVTVYRKIAKFEGKSAFSSWLYRITVNTALMLIRKKRQKPTVSVDEVL
ncbi:MAG: sigma-70 family RNA polymerase sigma factor, partial [Bdellovibrionales bacterium]|nr:sigma-70 family RNA polymerase sigma factor [Bdellovibrionales bacterium]